MNKPQRPETKQDIPTNDLSIAYQKGYNKCHNEDTPLIEWQEARIKELEGTLNVLSENVRAMHLELKITDGIRE